MVNTKRRFEVSGTDEEGDVHIFRTDDTERADSMRRTMEEDLVEVELVEKRSRKAAKASSES